MSFKVPISILMYLCLIGCGTRQPIDQQLPAYHETDSNEPKYIYGDKVVLRNGLVGKVKSDPIKSFDLWAYHVEYFDKNYEFVTDRFYEFDIIEHASPELCGYARFNTKVKEQK